MRGSEGDAPHETCAHRPGTVRGEGVEKVLARSAPAGRTVFDPEQWTGQVGQPAGEVFPYDLGGQIARHLLRRYASDPGEFLAHDDGSIAACAFVDPDPAAPGPEPVARTVMHVLVREVHLISQPAFYRVASCQARSNSCSLSGRRPARPRSSRPGVGKRARPRWPGSNPRPAWRRSSAASTRVAP